MKIVIKTEQIKHLDIGLFIAAKKRSVGVFLTLIIDWWKMTRDWWKTTCEQCKMTWDWWKTTLWSFKSLWAASVQILYLLEQVYLVFWWPREPLTLGNFLCHIFSCPKGSSIDDKVTGGAAGAAGGSGGAAILSKSREVQFRSFSKSGNCWGMSR